MRGIDNDPETVKIAREKVKEVVCIKQISGIKRMFPGERLDAVISSFLLQKPTLTPAEISDVIRYANIALTEGDIHIHAAAHKIPLQYFKSQGITTITSISANPGIYPYYHLLVGKKNSKRSASPMEQGEDSVFAGSSPHRPASSPLGGGKWGRIFISGLALAAGIYGGICCRIPETSGI